MQYTDWLLTEDGDLDITNGLTIVRDEVTVAKQQLSQALDLWWGEWFLDVSQGLPYKKNPNEDLPTNIRYFLGAGFKNPPEYIASSLDRYIRNLNFISKVKSSYTFDARTRIFRYVPVCTLLSGQTFPFEFPPIDFNQRG